MEICYFASALLYLCCAAVYAVRVVKEHNAYIIYWRPRL